MLQKTPTTTITRPRQFVSIPIRTIGAQNLASRDPGERAHLAAQWMLGWLLIDPPTAALAAQIFGCSAGSVHRALAEHELPATHAELLVHHWRDASTAERAAFGRAAGVSSVWDGAIVPNIA